jgi:hypothetical protein
MGGTLMATAQHPALLSLRRRIECDAHAARHWLRRHWLTLSWVGIALLAVWVVPLRAIELANYHNTKAPVCGAVRG